MNDAGAFEFYENPENRESVPGTPSRRRPLRLYAVVLRDYKVVWIDYFWATDADRAAGEYSIIGRDDGKRQWAYKGRPLYRWINDKAPGDRTGEGFKQIWHVARP